MDVRSEGGELHLCPNTLKHNRAGSYSNRNKVLTVSAT